MVTYNQEKFICEALNSILNNKVLPDLIILRDDCSTDNTWRIIKEFVEKYPEIFDAKQNDHNLGIYDNMNLVWSLGIHSDCDILSWCSGDDLWAPNVIENLNRAIEKNNIDVKNEEFVIVTNSYLLFPNGKRSLWNNYKLRNKDIRLHRLGKKLNYREIGVSRNIFKNGYEPLRKDLGLASDTIFVLNNEAKVKKWYFENFEAAYYRVSVGVVSRENVKKLLKSEADAYKTLYNSEKFNFNRSEKKLIELWISFDNYIVEQSICNWLSFVKSYFSNFENIQFFTFRMFVALLPPLILNVLVTIKSKLKEKRDK